MVDFLISAGVILLFLFGIVVFIGYCLDVPHIQRDPLGGGFYITENGRRALRGEPPAPGFFERFISKKQDKLQAEISQSQAKLLALEEELARARQAAEDEEEEDDYEDYEDDENDPMVKWLSAEVELNYQINELKEILQEPLAQAKEDYIELEMTALEDTPPIFWEDFAAVKQHFAKIGDQETLALMQAKENQYVQLKQQVQALLYPDSAIVVQATPPARPMPPPLPPLNRY